MLEERVVTMEKKASNRPSSVPQKQNGSECKKTGEEHFKTCRTRSMKFTIHLTCNLQPYYLWNISEHTIFNVDR